MAFGVSQTYASQSVENLAKKAVCDFFDAVKNNDVESALNTSIDKRDNATEADRRKLFAEGQKDVKGYQILSVKKIDDNKAFVTVKVNDATSGDVVMKYPVVKVGSKWMMDITHADQVEDQVRN